MSNFSDLYSKNCNDSDKKDEGCSEGIPIFGSLSKNLGGFCLEIDVLLKVDEDSHSRDRAAGF